MANPTTPAEGERAGSAVFQCPTCDYRAEKPGTCMNCKKELVREERAADAEAQTEIAADAETDRAKKPAAKPDAKADAEAEDEVEDAKDGGADEDAEGEGDEEGKPWSKKKKSADAAELRGMLIGAGVADPDNALASVRALIADARRATVADAARAEAVTSRAALEARAQDMETTVRSVKEALGDAAPEGVSLVEAVRLLLTGLHTAKADAERLTPLADDGRAYRQDLVAEALAEGVRAYGPDFAEDTYRTVLENASLETVKRMRADWRTVGDRQFQPGRVTTDVVAPEGKPAAEAAAVPTIPDAAFKG